jgi:hypothetical protein
MKGVCCKCPWWIRHCRLTETRQSVAVPGTIASSAWQRRLRVACGPTQAIQMRLGASVSTILRQFRFVLYLLHQRQQPLQHRRDQLQQHLLYQLRHLLRQLQNLQHQSQNLPHQLQHHPCRLQKPQHQLQNLQHQLQNLQHQFPLTSFSMRLTLCCPFHQERCRQMVSWAGADPLIQIVRYQRMIRFAEFRSSATLQRPMR